MTLRIHSRCILIRKLFRASCLFVCVSAAVPSVAFEVNPLIVSIEPQSGERSAQIEVVNKEAVEIGVTIGLFELKVENGVASVGHPANDSFLVLPPAATIPASSRQTARIQWIGSRPIENDLSYVAVVEQVPVDIDDSEKSGLEVAFTFHVLIHVTAQRSAPVLSAKDIALNTRNNAASLGLTITNTGNGNAHGDQINIVIDQNGQEVRVPKAAVKASGEHFFIPPGSEQSIQILLDEPIRKTIDDDVNVIIVYQEK